MNTLTSAALLLFGASMAAGWLLSTHARRRLSRQLLTDRLTGLPNRAALVEQFARVTRRGRSGAVAVLLLDLDGFKQVNDTFGHAAGNAVLRHVAGRLSALAEASHRVRPVRLHGDEFAVLITDLPAGAAGFEAAGCWSAMVADSICTPLLWAHQPITPSVSVGSAVAPVEYADLPTLLHAADQRMYALKRRQAGDAEAATTTAATSTGGSGVEEGAAATAAHLRSPEHTRALAGTRAPEGHRG